ncbi:MAG TPA: hypothetical protein VHY84_06780 [Bryobacteraceae bacterium]|nr:hypothetical protein [Bryobacteraceae bacterium]
MTINEIVAPASVIVSIGTNVALYTHLSATTNMRFDSFERRFDSFEHRIDLMLSKMVTIEARH